MAHRFGVARNGRRLDRPVLVSAVALVLTLAGGGCGSQKRPAMELSPCTVQGISARCGTLGVPEDRLTATGRRIDLRVVVVPAEGAQPRPDPVVYFAGGPGDAATEHVSDMVTVRGLRDRDLLFVDQRGTGGSHRLACPSPPSGTGPDDAGWLASYVSACLHGLDGNPRFYTTAMAADDVADVLTALGHDRANLYGGSYGATIAQVFQRRHPGMVRTMTLLGGTLLDVPIFERLPASSQAALDDVLARCRSDTACSTAFPRLTAEWQLLLADLRAAPVTVPAEPAPGGRPCVLTAELFAAAVHQLLLSADSAAQLPWLVHTLATTPDRASAVVGAAARLGDLFAGDDTFLVMTYVTRCNEAWARFDPDAVAANGRNSYYLDAALANARYWDQACALLPPAGKAAEVEPPTVSQTPVLMINGSADPQDPPSSMAGAGQRWPRSLQLVEPHQSHSSAQWQCHETVVDAFIELGTVEGLPTDCLATMQVPRFVTS